MKLASIFFTASAENLRTLVQRYEDFSTRGAFSYKIRYGKTAFSDWRLIAGSMAFYFSGVLNKQVRQVS